MKFVNEGTKIRTPEGKEDIRKDDVSVEAFQIFDLPFGETCDIPDGYSHPQRAGNGARLPSIIEKLAPQLKPADPKERKIWLRVPPPGRSDGYREHPVPSVEALVRTGLPQGVAEIEHKKAVAARDEERKARTKAQGD
jgi:hypothetical protein